MKQRIRKKYNIVIKLSNKRIIKRTDFFSQGIMWTARKQNVLLII